MSSDKREEAPKEPEYNKEQFEKQFQMHENQQKMIRQEIEAESPLIGDIFPLEILMDQFSNNQGFYIKIHNLLTRYKKYRKTRRDGSCFYRALLFSIFQKIVVDKNNKLRDHFIERIKSSKEHLLAAKFQGIIFEDLQEDLLDKLNKNLPSDLEELLKIFRNPQESNYLVLMLRYITSGQLRNNAILYETFIFDQIPMQLFCQTEVQPIDKEADQLQIMALLNYLNVAIKIIYLDGNANQQAYKVILPESAKEQDVVAQLLYRPGHYDILYQ